MTGHFILYVSGYLQSWAIPLARVAQHGVLGIFPEGGSWASVLRPARPGTAYLAVQSGAPLLPIGLDSLVDLFPRLRQGRCAPVTVRIGKPFGPFQAKEEGEARRSQLEKIGTEIMKHIAELIPERHGVLSTDPQIRATAQEVAAYPYDRLNER
jgi:1-acyl-sn-glycerol-3-phosphate acyltransferase